MNEYILLLEVNFAELNNIADTNDLMDFDSRRVRKEKKTVAQSKWSIDIVTKVILSAQVG
ncbi:hypothetical protein MOD48_07020 [Bacillus spizizenii]|nr:hypothetical protein [Bacillus spizizenii]MCY8108046.1 hypothetical protein [Bacillus spizizenii]MCY8307067.1 hypothetical protein [Bacillus spizizenii]MCY8621075.1 hypothetical protein [Bacillus spizizenii]MCY8631456.1 hypothetical protein [Bacillus spizizenii]